MSDLPVLTECPFCDHVPRYQEDDSTASGGYNYWVLCGECGATSDYYATPEEAAAAWNRRTPQPVTPAGGEVEPAEVVDAVEVVAKCAEKFRGYSAQGRRGRINSTTAFRWAAEEMEALAEELRSSHPPVADAALVRDAERWRYVRDNADITLDEAVWFVTDSGVRINVSCFGRHENDRAIDAALNQRGGG